MTIEELAARVGELEAANSELTARLARRGTMKQTLRCACGGTTIIQFAQVREVGNLDVARPLGLAMKGSFWAGSKPLAPLEAFACFACGYVEWHVSSFEGVEIDGQSVIRHGPAQEAPEEPGPYR